MSVVNYFLGKIYQERHTAFYFLRIKNKSLLVDLRYIYIYIITLFIGTHNKINYHLTKNENNYIFKQMDTLTPTLPSHHM